MGTLQNSFNVLQRSNSKRDREIYSTFNGWMYTTRNRGKMRELLWIVNEIKQTHIMKCVQQRFLAKHWIGTNGYCILTDARTHTYAHRQIAITNLWRGLHKTVQQRIDSILYKMRCDCHRYHWYFVCSSFVASVFFWLTIFACLLIHRSVEIHTNRLWQKL